MEAELRALFYDQLITFAASVSLPVAFPNVPFDKPTGSASHYLKIYTLPVKPSTHSVCGESRFRWILQVSIYSRDGVGELNALAYADTLRDTTFPMNSEHVGATQTFKVVSPPYPAPPIPMDGWFSVPVSFTIQTIQ